MMSDAGSRVWLITGCSSGLGRSLARAVLERGERAVVTARDASKVADLAAIAPDRALAAALDVTDERAVEEIVESAIARFGRIDVLVNNAGVGLVGALEESTDAEARAVFETNLFAPLRLIRAVAPIFRGQGSGRIINISAIAAVSNEVGFSWYGASKAALDAAAESVAGELAAFGVKVTQIVPGPFRTDFIARSMTRSERRPEFAASVGKFAELLGRIDGRQTGDPDKAAQAILAVADSDQPPFRLVLGKYAVDKFRKKMKSHLAEIDQWEEVGRPTDY
ncbi:MAG: oxidoreductase [Isosphaeraceae bacterium]|nr:oxidoreductase [Isosphaeraceae bacterium]